MKRTRIIASEYEPFIMFFFQQSSSQEEETKWSPEMLALARAPASGWWSRAKILKIASSSEVGISCLLWALALLQLFPV